MQLASCEYIRQGASVLITGPAGVGKSYQASALGYQACLSGHKVRYFNMNKLLEEMQMARIEAKAAKFFDRMAEVDLLIIEDFGMKFLDGQQLLDLELIENRHAKKNPPSSPASCRSKTGTTSLPGTPPWPMPYSTGSQKRHTESSSPVTA